MSIKDWIIIAILCILFLYWLFLPKLNPNKWRNLHTRSGTPISLFAYVCMTLELLIFLCLIICKLLSVPSSIIKALIYSWLACFFLSWVNILWADLKNGKKK